MRAIQSVAVGQASIVDIPEPDLGADCILVRPHYVGNNPCDYLVTDFEPMFTEGQILGCDYSGIVENVGADVKTTLKPGDKVCGALAAGVGFDHTRGAFAELVPAYGDFAFPLPNNVAEAEAATLGVGVSTIAVSFYQDFGFPLPDDCPKFGEGKPFLVYGGSTATGLLAIQFAKLSGFRVITTCSPRNFDLVKARGADEVYDYHDFDKCVETIRASVGDDLQYAYVCVGGEEPAKLCAEVLSSKGGKFVTVAGTYCPRKDVQSVMTYGQSVMADPYRTNTGLVRRTAETKAMGERVWTMTLRYLEEGKIKPPPFELRQGLDGALKGIDDLRNGLVSGKKIISQLVR